MISQHLAILSYEMVRSKSMKNQLEVVKMKFNNTTKRITISSYYDAYCQIKIRLRSNILISFVIPFVISFLMMHLALLSIVNYHILAQCGSIGRVHSTGPLR